MESSNKIWVEKYEPKTIDDLVVNKDKILKIKNWLINFNNPNQPSTIMFCGSHGIGKNASINIVLKELGYEIKILTSNNIKTDKIINEIIDSCEKKNNIYHILNGSNNNNNIKYALIIDDTETITLTSEKESLIELCKNNDKNKMLPIIFISNNQHSKLLIDIKKLCIKYDFDNPSIDDLKIIIKKIILKENMKINDEIVLNSIAKYSQNDVRRLIFILQDLYLTYGNDEINVEKLQAYFNYSKKKDIDIGLYEATKHILDNYKSINNCMELYEMEKVLLPLMIYENYYKSMFTRNQTKDKQTLVKQLDISRRICDSISKGDVIETNIYTDQNWTNQNIHGFYTICECSYTLNSIIENEKNNLYYDLDFSSDLNKTSLKNINRKNITTLQQTISHKNLDDILYINKLIYTLVDQGKFKEAYKICKDYPIDIKCLEVIIKIDKSNDKITLTPKNRRLFC